MTQSKDSTANYKEIKEYVDDLSDGRYGRHVTDENRCSAGPNRDGQLPVRPVHRPVYDGDGAQPYLGASDNNGRLGVRLVDGIIYSFQEQTMEDQVMLDGFGTVVNALGIRVKPYLAQIVSTILWRLNNKSAKVRQQAAYENLLPHN